MMYEYMSVEEIIATMSEQEMIDLMMECYVDEMAKVEGWEI